MAAYTAIDDPGLFFNTVIYSGSSSNQTITGVGFQADTTWFKNRNNTANHTIQNSVVGTGKRLSPDRDVVEGDEPNGLGAWNSDGFTFQGDYSGSGYNESGRTYVAWNWKAGTSFSNDASATSVGSIDSTGSISTDDGFGIISWVGTGVDATIAHGLGVAPKIVFVKNRSATNKWRTSFTIADGSYDYMHINATDGISDEPVSAPTSSVFSVYSHAQANGDGNNMIAYVFAEKQGFSKFGSYVGNGNVDGSMIFLGFRPAMIIIKDVAGNNWNIVDNKRLGYNSATTRLYPNNSNVDDDGDYMDLLSNGFKPLITGNDLNGSGHTYIYMAFAEAPFVNSNGVPCNAR